ncbi:Trk system potassium uptake protein TrkA [Methanosarcina siciliae C2J]|uniref:Trk system potassium uptake protein TrkA n=3 Tax=Methanosarcina siciliae TaxID=38027 RepID=A0A0E3PCR2_9EURY|nr:cation:proton antiporter [Methanosarcina siciliae]AKB27917.1 Trk system potassium uptake protein TrkA [Methanosarcina siciliae T4/M]AKB31838.1 Trk system potassium uptake protein TrkA [Methanosarcina siciliae HI350]AKB37871.1 Trk system potassium uptake protein TrkA [Methanosarcina siciliae C2J]
MLDPILLLGLVVAVLVMSLVAQALSFYFRIPFIIFLLIEGIIAGPEVLNLVNPALYVDGLSTIVAISVSVIVFDGGLHIDLKHIRMVQESVLKLTTIGVFVTFLGTTVLTSCLIGLPLELAALFGALVTATGPTVITPIVRNIQVSHKLGKILELEGVLNDAASVILAAMVFEWVAAELSGTDAVVFILYRLGIGIALGSLSGFALRWFFTRGKAISNRTARLVSLTAVFSCFVLSEYLGNESGILAVAIFGIILGTSEFPYKDTIKEFKSDIVIVMLSLIFILLAAMIKFEYILRIGASGIALVMLLIFVIRPFAVFVSMWNSQIGTNEKLFISFVGPRGVVPTAVATYFAIKLDSMGIPGGQTLVGLVFLTVIITVFMSGSLSKKVAEVLEVIPMEILIIGGGKVGRILAERFDKRGENVVVVDISEDNCKKCMELGIRTVQGDAGDVNVLKKAGIENAKYVVATTNQDNTNLLFCQLAKASFGFRGDQLVARVNEIENLQAFWNLGIRSMSPAMTTAVVLDNMIGRPHLFSMCEVGGEGDMMEVKVTNPRVIGQAIKDIQFPEKSLLVMVQRGSDSIIAHGNLVLEYEDIVTVIGEGDAAKQTASILHK